MPEDSFGQLLRGFRAAAGLAQAELAQLAGLSLRGISDLERGARRSPQPATLRRIFAVLDLAEEDRQVLQAAAQRARPTLAQARAPSLGLPMRLTSFVGRGREQSEIIRLLGTRRVVTLTGAGGIGKTRLALAVAGAAVPELADRAVMVELGELRDPRLVVEQVATALEIREHAGQSIEDGLHNALANVRLLIVLDNCEHLLSACSEFVASSLSHCEGLRILATSREPLGQADEHIWPVPALAVGSTTTASVERIARYSAVELFVDRARMAWPPFQLTEHNAPIVARICRRLDGLPLAIELAAARLRVLDVEQLELRLEDRFRVLIMGAADAPARHQTLEAAIAWSCGLLNDTEQLLFDRLSVFRGGASLEAVEAVCASTELARGDVADLLHSLVEKSLVQTQPQSVDKVRLTQLDTLRDYAATRVVERGEADALSTRHLAYYTQLAQRAEPQLRGPDQVAWLDRLEREHDNIRAALSWVLRDDSQVDQALRLAGAITPFWIARGHVAEGRRWLAGLLALDNACSAKARAQALRGAGSLAFHSGEYDLALALHEDALALFRELDDQRQIASELNWIAMATSERGDRPGAFALFEQSLALSKEIEDPWSVAAALGNMGITARRQLELDRAWTYMRESCDLFRATGDDLRWASMVNNLGNVAMDRGDLQQAARCYRNALQSSAQLGEWTSVARSIEGLAGVMVRQRRNPGRAAQLLGAAEALRERSGIPRTLAWRANHDALLGQIERMLGRAGLAAAWRRGQALSRERALQLAARGD